MRHILDILVEIDLEVINLEVIYFEEIDLYVNRDARKRDKRNCKLQIGDTKIKQLKCFRNR